MKATTEHYELGHLADISAGYSVRGSVGSLPDGGVGILQIGDVRLDEGVRWDSIPGVLLAGRGKPDFLRDGDVLFTARGSRNVALALSDVPEQVVCSSQIFVIRLHKGEVCLPAYLAWCMNQAPAQTYFQRSATGTNILNVRREVLEKLVVPLLPLEQQRAIVGLDETVRRERIVLQRLIENRERQMEALAAQWLQVESDEDE